MKLKPFEAGRYDGETLVLLNPVNGKQELFSETEFQIVKFLKENENQSLLALLIPNIGIAKKAHIEHCLQVLAKLKRMQVLDFTEITGRAPLSHTGTVELAPVKREKLAMRGFEALAAVVYGLGGKAFAWAGPFGLLYGSLALAAMGFLFYPFQETYLAVRSDALVYPVFFLTAYFAASFALGLRALLQGAFLRSLGREAARPAFVFVFGLIAPDADLRSIALLGYRARLHLAMLGQASPFVFAAFITLLMRLHVFPLVLGFAAISACLGVALLLACPFLSFDAADALQVLFFRDELEEKVALRLREFVRPVGSISREVIVVLVLAVVWGFAWLDCLRAFWETMVARLASDVSVGGMPAVGAGFLVAMVAGLATSPLLFVLFHFLQAQRQKARKRLVLSQGQLKDSLNFEERIGALEKIPLFAYLNGQERLVLLNEMQPSFFPSRDFLVHQGELGKEFFVLVKGQANAYYTDMQGKDYLLADLHEGDAFGEIALIDDVPRTASIVSDGGCIALVLRKDGFDRFAQSLGSADRVKALVRLTSFFRRHPLFSKLAPRDQAQLIDSFRYDTVTAGERISAPEERFFVIYSGSVRVDLGTDDTEANLQADDCFGYANPYHAKFFALEGTGLLSVGLPQFHGLIWEKLVQKPELFI